MKFFLGIFMQAGREYQRNQKALISTIELKRLCIELKDRAATTCVRFRMIGQMWQDHFCSILAITDDDRVLVKDEVKNRLLSIDLSNVMQFELDNRYQSYQPNFHYDVTPMVS